MEVQCGESGQFIDAEASSSSEGEDNTWVFTKLKQVSSIEEKPKEVAVAMVEECKEQDDEEEYYSDDGDDDFVCWENGKLTSKESWKNTDSKPVTLKKYENRINVGKYEPYDNDMSKRVSNEFNAAKKRMETDRVRVKDKCDRATVEQVLDPRTRMILLKLINRNVIEEINGCISTGKEANVYHATNKEGEDKALKIYKTSILTFKDRDKYVSGEYRFRHGYCRHNPRKMVKLWAEKVKRIVIVLLNSYITFSFYSIGDEKSFTNSPVGHYMPTS